MMDRIKTIPITIILLAGGKSSRIGLNKDKGQMRFSGIRLIDRVISNITSVHGLSEKDIMIVGPKEKFSHFNNIVEDIYPLKGPLGGMYSGLQASLTFFNLVIGYDMPFIESSLIQYMICNTESYDVIIPCHDQDLLEPLCAIYSKNCLPVMKKNIQIGKLAVRDIFPFLKVRLITEAEIKKFDPEMISFFNINYQDDFSKAEEIYQKRRMG